MSLSILLSRVAPLVGAVAVMAAPVEAPGHARPLLAVSVAMVLAWLFETLHPAIVGFIGAFLFCATAGLEFEEAFAGFGTTAPWFLYGVLMVYGAAESGGLLRWLGRATPSALVARPLPAVAMLIALGLALTPAVESSLARASVLVVLAGAWGHRLPAQRAVLSLVAVMSGVAVGNALAAGLVPGLVTSVGLLAGAAALLRRTDAADAAPAPAPAAAEAVDWRIGLLLLAVVGLWLTSSLHGLAPAWVGLAAGLVCALPGIARASGAHAKPTADPLALILAGTAISMPVVLHESGAADLLASLLPRFHEAMVPALHTYWVSVIYRAFSPDMAGVALAPPAPVALGGGAALAWTLAGSTLFSLHQAPALALALSVGGVRGRQVLVLGGVMLLVGSAAVLVW